MNRKTKVLLGSALLCLFALFVAGCAGPSAGRGRLGFAKPKELVAPPEVMEKIVNAGDDFDYPNAHIIIIDSQDSVIFDEDGRETILSYGLLKPITIQGLRSYNSFDFGYDSQMMDVDIIYAMVIHPDSTIELVPDSAILDRTALEGEAEADIYWSNLRKKIVNMPKLNMGDAIAIAYKYSFKKPYFEGVISGASGFQGTEQIHHTENIYLIPKSKWSEVKYKIINDKNGIIKKEEYDWKGYHVLKFWADTVEPIVPEVSMAPPIRFIPLIMFSNVSWQELSKKAWEITEPPMKITDPELKKLVKSLVETCKTELDSVKAIGYWVSQKVRYLGISLGDKEGITPHDVNETFKARSGVCKDKSALAVAMLREAGIKAYNVLTNPSGDVLKDVALNQFNHQIVLARLKDGREVFIDVTDELCRDLLPGIYSKRGYLVLSPDGEDLKYFPIIDPDKNGLVVSAKTTIDDDGNLKSKVEIKGYGLSDEIIRQIGRFLHSKEDRERFINQLLQKIDPNANLLSFQITPEPVTDLSTPAMMVVEYEIPEYATVAGDYLLLQAPMVQQVFDLLADGVKKAISLQQRKFPLRLTATYSVKTDEEIELPKVYKIASQPEQARIDNKYFTFRADYKVEGKRVKYSSYTALKDIDVPVEDYQEFRDAFNKYQTAGKGMLILNIEKKSTKSRRKHR